MLIDCQHVFRLHTSLGNEGRIGQGSLPPVYLPNRFLENKINMSTIREMWKQDQLKTDESNFAKANKNLRKRERESISLEYDIPS